MNRIGEVVRIAQGLAIVRAPDGEVPEIGTPVVDESLAECGRIVDVFGPVDRPFVAVSPSEERHLPSLLGAPLYAR